jgi:hypothetical protein
MTPIKFHDLYSAFEHALVRSQFRRGGRGAARPDWVMFSEDVLGEGFYNFVLRNGLAPTLTVEPPRRLLNEPEGARWEEQGAPVHDVVSLIRAVGLVRHNLSHGNKYLGGDNEKERSDALIADGGRILLAALERCPQQLADRIRSRT